MAKDSLHTKTILLVDDEPELLHLLETVLRADGFERIVTASDVTSGLAAYEQHHPDLATLMLCCPMEMDLHLFAFSFVRKTFAGHFPHR